MTERVGDPVLVTEQIGAIRRLTLNRPDKRNALSGELSEAVVAEMADAGRDLATSVVVIRGAGPAFSAGWDLAEHAGEPFDPRLDRQAIETAGRRMDAIWACPLPVLAQVHGHCLAGAADLVLHCDLVLVATDAAIGHPAVRNLGVPSSNMWLYRLGAQMAKRLLFTGDVISGSEAVTHGLALSAHDADELDAATLDLARRIATSSRDALVSNKRVLNHGIELMGRSSLQRFAQAEDALAHLSPDAEAFRRDTATSGVAGAARRRDAAFETGTGDGNG